MKDLHTVEFEPTHQPYDTPVSFTLTPLDLKGQYEIQASMTDSGRPGWAGVVAASRCITGWKGEQLGQFSRAAVRQIVDGDSSTDWMIWLIQITGKLYGDSLMKDAAAKKS
jgi:hypothetical protein